jgi:hypothetical protein
MGLFFCYGEEYKFYHMESNCKTKKLAGHPVGFLDVRQGVA